MPQSFPDLVDTAWLAQRLGAPGLRVIDASWHAQGGSAQGRADYLAGHLPGALFLDLDALAQPGAALAHTFPAAAHFARTVGALGVARDDALVVYDSAGIWTAPRAWWMFKAMGHRRVAVLDGGLPKWRAEGRAIETDAPATAPVAYALEAEARPARLADRERMRRAMRDGEQMVDARTAGRYQGLEPEPRPGLRAGHIPGAVNLPYTRLVDAGSGTLKPPAALREQFRHLGLDTARTVLCSCGSGVTACVLALALAQADAADVAVYDGSWSEWGADPALPVATGPQP